MMPDIRTVEPRDLFKNTGANPVDTYLDTLSTDVSRATMIDSLKIIARLGGHDDIYLVPWASTRYPEAVQLKAKLTSTTDPTTA